MICGLLRLFSSANLREWARIWVEGEELGGGFVVAGCIRVVENVGVRVKVPDRIRWDEPTLFSEPVLCFSSGVFVAAIIVEGLATQLCWGKA